MATSSGVTRTNDLQSNVQTLARRAINGESLDSAQLALLTENIDLLPETEKARLKKIQSEQLRRSMSVPAPQGVRSAVQAERAKTHSEDAKQVAAAGAPVSAAHAPAGTPTGTNAITEKISEVLEAGKTVVPRAARSISAGDPRTPQAIAQVTDRKMIAAAVGKALAANFDAVGRRAAIVAIADAVGALESGDEAFNRMPPKLQAAGLEALDYLSRATAVEPGTKVDSASLEGAALAYATAVGPKALAASNSLQLSLAPRSLSIA